MGALSALLALDCGPLLSDKEIRDCGALETELSLPSLNSLTLSLSEIRVEQERGYGHPLSILEPITTLLKYDLLRLDPGLGALVVSRALLFFQRGLKVALPDDGRLEILVVDLLIGSHLDQWDHSDALCVRPTDLINVLLFSSV